MSDVGETSGEPILEPRPIEPHPSEEPPAELTPEEMAEVLEDAREDALDFLEGLLDAMELEGEVEVSLSDGPSLAATILHGDASLLIGRRGQTLDAIQELLRTVIQRQNRMRIRVTLDIEGYRDRRRDAVRQQALEAAERVLEDGEVELEAMPAFERKVVHDTVAEIGGVTSFSEGQEPRRRVILRPE